MTTGGMRWEEERYVRLYTRDTITWLSLSLEAQGLLALLLRKVDRAGILRLGARGPRAVAAAIGHASRWDTIRPALEELLAEQVVTMTGEGDGTVLVFPRFMEAQEAKQSDRARQQAKRERDRDRALAAGFQGADALAALDRSGVTPAVTLERHAGASRNVTECHAGAVTQGCHAGAVTPSLAVPSRAVPCLAEDPSPAEKGAPDGTPPKPLLLEPPTPRGPRTRAPKKPTNPRHAPLTARLAAVFLEVRGVAYGHSGGADAAAVTRLCALGDDAEVERRWRVGLAWTGFPRCDSLTQLAHNWNTYAVGVAHVGAGAAASGGGALPPVPKGMTRRPPGFDRYAEEEGA